MKTYHNDFILSRLVDVLAGYKSFHASLKNFNDCIHFVNEHLGGTSLSIKTVIIDNSWIDNCALNNRTFGSDIPLGESDGTGQVGLMSISRCHDDGIMIDVVFFLKHTT